MSPRAILAAAALLCATAHADGLTPIEAGLTVYTRHGSHNSGPGAWESNTWGVYALWDAGEIGPFAMRASAVALRLSAGRTGIGGGFMAEWGHLYGSLVLMHGYQKVHFGAMPQHGATMDCVQTCAWRTAEDRLVLVPSVGVRVDLPQRFVLRLQLQPKPPASRGSSYYLDHREARSDWSLLLTVGRAF